MIDRRAGHYFGSRVRRLIMGGVVIGLLVIPRQLPIAAIADSPCATVVGYLRPGYCTQYLRYDLLSHIACFSIWLDSSGDGSLTSGSADAWPGDWSEVIADAQAYGVKVVVVAILQNTDGVAALINHSSHWNTFLSSIMTEIDEAGPGAVDGLNIDFEGRPAENWALGLNDFMAWLTSELHAAYGAGFEVTVAGPPSDTAWSASWDLPGLANSCDGVVIMAYSHAGSWSTQTSAVEPLVQAENALSDYGVGAGTDGAKLILGVPYYGNHWITHDSDQPGAPVTPWSPEDPGDWVGPAPRFYDTQPESERYGLLWHADSQTSWYRWHDGADWHQVWNENAASLSLKYQLALEQGLQGVAVWAMGFDGCRSELWDEIEAWFGEGKCKLPPDCVSLIRQDFDSHSNGEEVLFRHPRYSGTTMHHLAESPDIAAVTDASEPFSGTNCYKLQWQFVDDGLDRWVRVTTHQSQPAPNPTIELDKPIRVRFRLDGDTGGPLRVAVGVRETNVDVPIGEDGGFVGDIEWIGAAEEFLGAPLGKRIHVLPGEWQTMIFDPASDPILGFTGDGTLYTETNKGTLEHLAFTSEGYANCTVYVDDVELLCSMPRCYVDADAPAGGDGATWSSAYRYLQDALAAAEATGGQVWVAAGTYKPDESDFGYATPGNREEAFWLATGVGIYGGFTGCETRLQQRNIGVNATILSGDIGTPGDPSDNSYHVVIGSQAGSAAVLDGFTISNANCFGQDCGGAGGGILIVEGSPTIVNCTISDNITENSGAGVDIRHSVAAFTNCAFVGNLAGDYGGGMDIGVDASIELANCTFAANWAGVDNGGVRVTDSGGGSLRADNCIFWGNTADSASSTLSAQVGGGAMTVYYSCIQDTDPDDSNIPFGGSFVGNIDDDPLFVDPATADLRLKSTSPCIDHGNDLAVPWGIATDVVSNDRFIDGDGDLAAEVDMGAFESAEAAAEDDLDTGETVTLNPGCGGTDPTVNAVVTVTNVSGADDAQISVVETTGDPDPNGAGQFRAFGRVVTVTKSGLADGEFEMTIQSPFDAADLEGFPYTLVQLRYRIPGGNPWALAVDGNTRNAENCDSTSCPVHPPGCDSNRPERGCNHEIEDTVVPAISEALGDYGVYWNPQTMRGFAWARVDHATDFRVGIDLLPSDLDDDGDVDLRDFSEFMNCFNGPDQPPASACAADADVDGDTDVDTDDLAEICVCLDGPDQPPACD